MYCFSYVYVYMQGLTGMLFFQAEDGIRDGHVTGVQTCALPIFIVVIYVFAGGAFADVYTDAVQAVLMAIAGTFIFISGIVLFRSEERRVGKECRFRC